MRGRDMTAESQRQLEHVLRCSRLFESTELRVVEVDARSNPLPAHGAGASEQLAGLIAVGGLDLNRNVGWQVPTERGWCHASTD